MLALLIGWRCLRAMCGPRPFFVQAAVRQAIMSTVVLDAAAALAARGMPAAIVLLLIPTLAAGQRIEPTRALGAG